MREDSNKHHGESLMTGGKRGEEEMKKGGEGGNELFVSPFLYVRV